MAAPVFSLHKMRTEGCGSFLWEECVEGAEIHTHVCAQYGDNAYNPFNKIY